jgi:hypothetical protein
MYVSEIRPGRDPARDPASARNFDTIELGRRVVRPHENRRSHTLDKDGPVCELIDDRTITKEQSDSTRRQDQGLLRYRIFDIEPKAREFRIETAVMISQAEVEIVTLF